MKRTIIFLGTFFTILIFLLLQINLINKIPLFGVAANMGLVLVVILSTITDKSSGLTIGIIYGTMMDIATGKCFGVYLLLFGLLGYIMGRFGNNFSQDNKWSMTVLISILTIIFEVCNYIIFVLIYNYKFEILTLILNILKEVVYNGIITLIVYKWLSALGGLINRGKSSYYLL